MSDRIIICTTDDTCPKHGKYIYYCPECAGESTWQDGERWTRHSDTPSG